MNTLIAARKNKVEKEKEKEKQQRKFEWRRKLLQKAESGSRKTKRESNAETSDLE